jgi:2-hydroxy-6-oxonona-2,4-dienedioate hydrolase
VLLVHGLGVSTAYFSRLADRLAPEMRVVAPDLPGWGASDRPRAPLDVVAAADVLAKIIVHEGLRTPMLVANSLGCQFAVELAVERPELVGPLVLISPTVDPRYRSVVRQALALAADWPREPWDLWPIIVRDYWTMGPSRLLRTAWLALDDRPEDKLPRVATPVLVLRGDRDAITTRPWAERCASLAIDGRFAAVPGAAHAAHFSRPQEVARLVLSFAEAVDDVR